MGPKPKKEKGKKKSKEKKDDGYGNGGVLTPEQHTKMLLSANQSLQIQLADRQEQTTKAIAAKRELQNRIDELERDFKDEQNGTFGITQDMTRQYKGMQEELLNRINTLENTITKQRDQLEMSRLTMEDLRKEKDQVISYKDAEIQEMKNKMDEMTREFGDMLKDTLNKMRERIEISTGNFESESGVPMIRRLEEINIGNTYNKVQ